jgi:hypothetical protein
MKIKHIFETALGFSLLTFSASAGSVPLVVGTYNFQLDGGGGGAEATLNGVGVQIYCDNFANEIYLGSTNSANVTQLGSSENLDETRFGEVSSWTSIDLTDTSSTGIADDAFFNSGSGDTAAARYAMAAYLVSQYSIPGGNSESNNQIQEAIWTLMDPAAYGSGTPLIDPSGYAQPTTDLEAAAFWYSEGGATNAFLSQFEVVSDANMTPGTSADGYVGVGGFQEQIVYTPAPEPRGSIWMLIGLFGVGGFLLQRARAQKLAPATA